MTFFEGGTQGRGLMEMIHHGHISGPFREVRRTAVPERAFTQKVRRDAVTTVAAKCKGIFNPTPRHKKKIVNPCFRIGLTTAVQIQ